MKVVLELKNKPAKDDILIFDGKEFECINKDMFLKNIKKEVFLLEERVRILEQENAVVNKEIKILKGEE